MVLPTGKELVCEHTLHSDTAEQLHCNIPTNIFLNANKFLFNNPTIVCILVTIVI